VSKEVRLFYYTNFDRELIGCPWSMQGLEATPENMLPIRGLNVLALLSLMHSFHETWPTTSATIMEVRFYPDAEHWHASTILKVYHRFMETQAPLPLWLENSIT
jgi:hypothetical protein